jgi:hypothetical protein
MQKRFAHSGSRITRPLKAVDYLLQQDLSIRRGRTLGLIDADQLEQVFLNFYARS